MLVPLAEVLALPSVQATSFEVVCEGQPGAMVRWVHSSEVYEMGGLLAGGEMLLTTGLGLHGRSAEQLSTYVRHLAEAGCVALCLEIGRSFFDVPAAMENAAKEHGLALITFHKVVPFSRIIEDFHERVVRARVSDAAQGVFTGLFEMAATGVGLRAILDEAARLSGCEARFVEASGHIAERSRVEVLDVDGTVHCVVRGPREVIGHVELRGRVDEIARALVRQLALAVSLELGRHPLTTTSVTAAQSFVTDVTTGVLDDSAELRDRLVALAPWFAATESLHVVALSVGTRASVSDVIAHIEHSWPERLGGCVAGVERSGIVVLVQGWPSRSTLRVKTIVSALVAEANEALKLDRVPIAVVGDQTRSADHVPRAVRETLDSLRLVRRHFGDDSVVTMRDVMVARFLSESVDPAHMTQFVAAMLGPLIAHEREHGGELINTLVVFLKSAGSKAAAAEALGLRRQSVYARLGRIEAILSVDLSDEEHRFGLGLALRAWRLVTGLDPDLLFDSPSPR